MVVHNVYEISRKMAGRSNDDLESEPIAVADRRTGWLTPPLQVI